MGVRRRLLRSAQTLHTLLVPTSAAHMPSRPCTLHDNVRPPLLDAMQTVDRGTATHGALLLASLKAAGRGLLLEVEARREAVAAATSATDAHHLTLQNLLYEKEHLLREIAECQRFPTPQLDRIELVPQDVALVAQAAAAAGGEGVMQPASAHEAFLLRLQHEMDTRRAMEALLQQERAAITALRAKNSAKNALIDSLPAHITAIEAATRPLQSAQVGLQLQAGSKGTRYARALGLPAPLYVLFSALEAATGLELLPPTYEALVATGESSDALSAVDAVPALSNSIPTPAEYASLRFAVPVARARAYDRAGGLLGGATGAATTLSVAAAAAPGGVVDAADGARSAMYEFSQLFTPHEKAVLLIIHLAQPQEGSERGGPALTAAVRFQYLPLLDVVTAQIDTSTTQAASAAVLSAAAARAAAAKSQPTASTSASSGAPAAAKPAPSSTAASSAPATSVSAATAAAGVLHSALQAVSAGGLSGLFGDGCGDSCETAQPLADIFERSRVQLWGESGSSASLPKRLPRKLVGRPYVWANALAGIAVLPLPPRVHTETSAAAAAAVSGSPEEVVLTRPSASSVISALRTRFVIEHAVHRLVMALNRAPAGTGSAATIAIPLAADCTPEFLAAQAKRIANDTAWYAGAVAPRQQQKHQRAGQLPLEARRALHRAAADFMAAAAAHAAPGGAGTGTAQLVSFSTVDVNKVEVGSYFPRPSASRAGDWPPAGSRVLRAVFVTPGSRQHRSASAGAAANKPSAHVWLAVQALVLLQPSYPATPLALHLSLCAALSAHPASGNYKSLPALRANAEAAAADATAALADGAIRACGLDAPAGLAALAAMAVAASHAACPSVDSLPHAFAHTLFLLQHALPQATGGVLTHNDGNDISALGLAGSAVDPAHQPGWHAGARLVFDISNGRFAWL